MSIIDLMDTDLLALDPADPLNYHNPDEDNDEFEEDEEDDLPEEESEDDDEFEDIANWNIAQFRFNRFLLNSILNLSIFFKSLSPI